MDEISLQFQGFRPSTFTQRYVGYKLTEIREQAPYGSTLRAVFKREQHNIKATLRIMSSAGQFFAVCARRPT